MSTNPLNDISRVYLEQTAVEAFVDPEQGEAPSGRSPLQNVSDHPKASNFKTAVETIRLEYSRGKGNFQWSGEMRRYWKEHRWRKHFTGLLLTLRDES